MKEKICVEIRIKYRRSWRVKQTKDTVTLKGLFEGRTVYEAGWAPKLNTERVTQSKKTVALQGVT
jgi:hypothetical protein